MMHADIVQTTTPDPPPARPEETLAWCTRGLTAADRNYFRRRAAQEAEASRASGCDEAKLAHEELATAYRLLCTPRKAPAQPHLASELAMFRFNPKPAG